VNILKKAMVIFARARRAHKSHRFFIDG